MVVPFRVLSRKILVEEVSVSQLIWYLLGVKKKKKKQLFGPRAQNRILVPFSGTF